MNCSSYFIKNKALFGSYPSQDDIKELEELGVRYFIDLTDMHTDINKIVPYKTNYTHISYPIKDHSTPTNSKTFASFILKIANIIKKSAENVLIYVNCVGGHGRSGIVVACLLCEIFYIPPSEALQYTTYFHSTRKKMREKWRKIGSPQTLIQKKFVQNFFSCLTIEYESDEYSFSNFAKIPVFVPDVGLFPSGEAAYQAFKNLYNIEYIQKLKMSESPAHAKQIGDSILNTRMDWNDIKVEILSYIVSLKIIQNENVKNDLLNTYLQPIYCDKKIFGTILTKIRNKFLEYL